MSTATTRTYRWSHIAPSVEATGLTYRQIDNWCRAGTISLELGPQDFIGSGKRRRFTRDDVDRLMLVSLLPDVATGGGPNGWALPSVWVSALWVGLTPIWLDHFRAGMLSAYLLRHTTEEGWVLVHPTRQHPFRDTDPLLRVGVPAGLVPARLGSERIGVDAWN